MRLALPMRYALEATAVALVGLVVGATLTSLPTGKEAGATDAPVPTPAQAAHADETRRRFDQAVAMLHARKYEYAITALHRVLEIAPRMPEAHVNMGFALLGLTRHAAARDFFATAVELRPEQANAYFGLAIANEGLQDLESALGAMRAFLHLSRADDPYRSRARAAIWEWEDKLGRHNHAQPNAEPAR